MRKEHTSVELVDDIDGSPATTTIEFSVGGKNYVIDLSDQHADEFNKALAPYIEHARHAPANRALRSVHGHWKTALPLPSEAC